MELPKWAILHFTTNRKLKYGFCWISFTNELAPAVPTVGELVEPVEGGNFLTDNWGVLLLGLLGFFDLVVRLTPTEKDNSIVNFLLTVFNAIIPNFRKGGGCFKLLSK